MYDIVIPLRRALLNEELRYTLRSIEKNMPGHKIWFSGYRPKFFSGKLNVVENATLEGNKYQKSHSNQMAACKHPEVSETFLLFNDDFFVMKPVTEFEDAHRGLVGIGAVAACGTQHLHCPSIHRSDWEPVGDDGEHRVADRL